MRGCPLVFMYERAENNYYKQVILMYDTEKCIRNICSLLENKYEKIFKVHKLGNRAVVPGGMECRAYCYPEECMDQLFTVRYYGGDSPEIIDYYNNALVEYDVKEYLSRKISVVAKDYFISVNASGYLSGYRESRNFTEYAIGNSMGLFTTVVINTEEDCKIEPDDLFPVVSGLFGKAAKVNGVLKFVLAENNTVQALKERIKECPVIDYNIIEICEDGIGFKTNIEDGAVTISKDEFIDSLY